MARRLPPLNALRTFEAAASHLSFTRAAEELFVTQAAVSHQIKALEDRLGVQLFNRRGRTLTLTEPAQRFLPAVRDSFDRLSAATDNLLQANTGTLNVTTLNSFAAMWLVPRLARFQTRHPDIAVRIHAADQVVDLNRQDYDIAIRYGGGKWPNLSAEKLFNDATYPVCNPAMLEGPHPLRVPEDLRHFTLLHEEMIDITWAHWLRAAGVDGIDVSKGPTFSHANMVIQAAVNGQGIALGRGPLIADELASGRLVRPLQLSLAGSYAHYFVCPEATRASPKVKAFRDWLFEEASRTEQSGYAMRDPGL